MDITAPEKGPATGPQNAPPKKTVASPDAPRTLDRVELIDRLANEMRMKSGLFDMPHAYFVAQVKLQLSGNPAFDKSLASDNDTSGKPASTLQSAACFHAWAMRD
nr:hypothetical protein [uncultured Gellertiella sp.]